MCGDSDVASFHKAEIYERHNDRPAGEKKETIALSPTEKLISRVTPSRKSVEASTTRLCLGTSVRAGALWLAGRDCSHPLLSPLPDGGCNSSVAEDAELSQVR
jgi:hypothetical protein